ncbi:MAG: TolC family protein [Phycisphaeraceae bacterium]|nr:TolC family protein [Phycisphaeraceae bacterium]MCW5762519.1 TolC family protein [Phycisphaeraceae bacterium]
MHTHRRGFWTLTAGGLFLFAGGCSSPLGQRSELELRRAMHETVRREVEAAERSRAMRTTQRRSTVADLGLSDRVLEQLQRDYDPNRYLDELATRAREKTEGAADHGNPIQYLMDEDLFGGQQAVVGVSLERAVKSAVRNNLDVAIAQFGPAQREADVVIAQAAFDWAFVGSLDWQDTDQPRASTAIPGFGGGGVVMASDQTVTGSAGLERTLITGGQFSIAQRYVYTDTRETFFGSVPSPDPSTAAALVLDFTQPVLRGFGSDVNLSEIRIRQNAERRAIAEFQRTLMSTVSEVESAYWDLVRAQWELVILSKLVARGEAVRDDIRVRSILDADPAQIADAVAQVESRKGDVLRAQRAVRQASDRLKLLINDPRLALSDEITLIPTDAALDQPIEFSLYDAILTAIDRRPEIQQAILSIDDASIRQLLAENRRLPQLDLRAQLALLGLDDDLGGATRHQTRGEFIDNFLLGVLLRQPIGNRAAEAGYRQSRLDRMQSVVAYRREVQAAIAQVRSALDDVVTNYRLIEQARTSRLAAAEALRTLLVKKELMVGGYTVERLNLELGQQASLAAAERAEQAALIDYNLSIARLHQAMGTVLERNRINFIVPDANQLLDGESVLDVTSP